MRKKKTIAVSLFSSDNSIFKENTEIPQNQQYFVPIISSAVQYILSR